MQPIHRVGVIIDANEIEPDLRCDCRYLRNRAGAIGVLRMDVEIANVFEVKHLLPTRVMVPG